MFNNENSPYLIKKECLWSPWNILQPFRYFYTCILKPFLNHTLVIVISVSPTWVDNDSLRQDAAALSYQHLKYNMQHIMYEFVNV